MQETSFSKSEILESMVEFYIIDKDIPYKLNNGKTDSNTFIIDIFGIYGISYKWFSSLKLAVYDQN